MAPVIKELRKYPAGILELAGLSPDLSPPPTEAFGARAARPLYSVRKNAVLAEAGLGNLRPWQEALAAYLCERNRNT